MDVLAELVSSTRAAVAGRAEVVCEDQLRIAGAQRMRSGDRRDFASAIRAPGLSVIAEHKRSSPSAGPIRDDLALEDVVSAYERGGAAAVSVLTEETRFGGALEDLRAARSATGLPILRKDFIVEPYQVHEAMAAGADAILLIVAAFPAAVDQLSGLQALAGTLGLDVLMEVHNRAELELALTLNPPIIGINNRNLATLEVDLGTTYELLPQIPADTIRVAESGFRERAELQSLAHAGVDAVLIGEALMRAVDIESACRELSRILP
jgi:indole-3-glycerol phosphate synthase